MNQIVDLGKVNRSAFSSLQAKRQYARASGYLDDGEHAALYYVGSHSYSPDVLDIGVGGGRTIPLMKRFCKLYTGIDYIGDMVTISRRRFPTETVLEMDARTLAFPSKSFDVVSFSNNGIDSVAFADREVILQQVHRVLRPCGLFVFSALNYHGKDKPQKRSAVGRVKDAVSLPVSLLNRRRLRKYNTDNGVVSTKTLNAHFCRVVATFTSFSEQVAQLERAQFYVEQVFDVDGDAVSDGSESPYLHYVVRRPIAT